MSREYHHVKEYETEILRLKEQGYTKPETGEKFGLSKSVLKRKHRREEKRSYGIMRKKENRQWVV